MIEYNNLFLAGGNSRNSGKTTLCCALIKQIALTQPVIGLKVSSIRPEEENFHGTHENNQPLSYSIFEETNKYSPKDTSKMLLAGAKKVFFIQTTDEYTEESVKYFFDHFITNQAVVCESRSLRKFIKPGLFALCLRIPPVSKEKDVAVFKPLADFIIDNAANSEAVYSLIHKIGFQQGAFEKI